MTAEVDTTIVDGYYELLYKMSNVNKKALIDKLSASMKEDDSIAESRFEKAFGALESEETAEQLIEEIRSSRLFTREIEPF
jgi:hypothetical protein